MKKLLFICFLSILSCQYSSAQAPHFRNYTVDDGLPSSHVYRAFQDSKGFMWFCTDKGVARFDGYKFEKFTTKNGLPNNDVWHCAEDRDGRIWFLSYANAFFYFDLKDDKFHVINNPYKEFHDSYVWCYLQNRDQSVSVILGNHFTVNIDIKTNNVFKANLIYGSYYPFIKGKDYLEKPKGTSIDNWHLRAFSEGFGNNLMRKKHVIPPIGQIEKKFWSSTVSMIFDDDKTIYGATDSICFYRNHKFTTRLVKYLSNYANDKLRLILNAGNINRKLIVTDKDIFVIDENLERIKQLDCIKDFSINTIYFDSENNLWLCTKNSGVFILSSTSIHSNIFVHFSDKMSITSMNKDFHENIWFGNNLGKIYFINSNKGIYEQKFNYTNQSSVKKIANSKNNILVLWNNSDYAVFNNNISPERNNFVSLVDIRHTTSVSKTIKKELRKGALFKNQNTKNVDVCSDETFSLASIQHVNLLECSKLYYRFIYPISDQPNIKILALKAITSYHFFIGTNKGLEIVNRYEKLQNLQALKQKYPILTKPISCFESDSQNALWVGTDGYGIYRFIDNKVQPLPELQGMIINHLYFDKAKNYLFVSTNEGIYVVIVKYFNQPIKYTVQKISLAQGLPTLEVNCTVTRGNDLFVGTSKGLAKLPIEEIINAQSVSNTTPLIIKNIKINRRDTTVSSFYNLTYQQNNIDFDFVALSYKSDKNIKYDYKLLSNNSNDTTWHPTEDLHKEFSLLPPGKYEFHLRAFDIEGVATQSIKPIIFVINPPFWQTLWFKSLIIFLILSAIILFFYLRTKNIQKKEQERTEINKKFAELELQALQAQMNPHFVFNALSAIQNFILNNNTEEATDYLSKFSRLMRLFLESSRNKYIPLRDEKLLLEYYIQLEKLRFSGKFTYQFIISENVGLDTEIPSMLLQPFIENAINHGLIYKENNEGKLTITFTMKDQKLICEIDDNGIGRKKATEIKNQSLKPYKSRGTEITEERLRSLELIENTKIEIIINDKFDENNIAQGTKVIIVVYL